MPCRWDASQEDEVMLTLSVTSRLLEILEMGRNFGTGEEVLRVWPCPACPTVPL